MQEENVGSQVPSPDTQDVSPSISTIRENLLSDKVKNVKHFTRRENLTLAYKDRSSLWNSICSFHAKTQCSEAFYFSLVDHDTTLSLDSLPDFVDPVLVDHYLLNSKGRNNAFLIVNAIAISHTHVLFAPLLYPTTALLLHYLPHTDAYKAICSILDSKKAYHLDQTPNAYCRSSMVLLRLTKKLSPKTYRWVEKSLSAKTEEVSHFFLTWPLWIFRALPVSYLVRLFDNFLLDGVRAFYRSCILILHLYSRFESNSSDGPSPRATPKVKRKFEAAETMLDGLIIFIRSTLPNMLSESQLIAKAYSIRGFSRKLLGKLSSCDAQELNKLSVCLPLKINSSEITVHQVNLNAVNASVLYYLSELKSSIVSRAQMEMIWDHLPSRHTVVKPFIVFTSIEHGTSLRNFLHVVDELEPLLILIKTADNETLGAFCSAAWGDRNKGRKFFGTGETFVFSFGTTQTLKVYKWVGYGSKTDAELTAGQQLFQCAVDGIDVGCGSLHICPDMNFGRSDVSSTFNSEPLSMNKEFKIIELEAIAFE